MKRISKLTYGYNMPNSNKNARLIKLETHFDLELFWFLGSQKVFIILDVSIVLKITVLMVFFSLTQSNLHHIFFSIIDFSECFTT